MPHKCARCNKIYEDNARELMEGCSCGSRVFLYIRGAKDSEKQQDAVDRLIEKKLSDEDLNWIEERFSEDLKDNDKTISLDVENLIQLGKGKYRLDISSLMKGDPLIIKSRKGIYYIDIAYAMRKK
ncbi:MAG: hypothetical protein B6U97_00940 [Candidatus Altiarchaeales archaeon ex4484_96]|nr:MAG: hypothetical protein B6U97_00940 [Candidatus Altiarchaeales archaeon ex4484_96]